MRGVAGTFWVLFFMGAFSFFLIEGITEYQKANSFHHVLDERMPIKKTSLSETSFIKGADDAVISELYAGDYRVNLTYDQIPRHVIEALVAVEDQSFYDHQGFDVQGIVRALLVNLESQSVAQGGSTVTQQLARNIYLSHEQTYERKLVELLHAYQLERHLTKEEILELYVNVLYFHNGIYGIEAASLFYFGKHAHELSLAECTFLIAIPNRPELYNPLLHKENTHTRQDWVLKQMKNEGFISDSDYDEAKEEEVLLNVKNKIDLFPDYVTYVHHEFHELIGHHHGYDAKVKQAISDDKRQSIRERWEEKVNELLSSGIRIHTALDESKQHHLVKEINHTLKGANLQGSAVMIDHDSHQIVALAGGLDYQKFDFNRVYQAYNQPGSAIKPFLSFAPYMEYTGVGPSTVIDASPFEHNGYAPGNFGGATYGWVPLDKSFARSYNTAAVRMLHQIGVEKGFEYLEPFEFSRVTNDHRVLSAALGTMEVSLLELTGAYTTFGNDGHFTRPRAITHVTDRNSNTIYEWDDRTESVWTKETNDYMRQLLQKVVDDGTGRAARLPGNRYAGGKTGTTTSFHDLWFVGLDDSYTTGIWLGQDTPSPIPHASERNLHTSLWKKLME
ncbi:transglycosylase domain-containing protein [Alteribacter aurantiacus]|uniref:transglycosylase domain-containing protein n=1 Tax=Alteribacter aurantiacus TaxID=254410 RepID=UPI0003F7A25E|nr:transglycosylase domain-containing protein [Alteribacter aurantiacus]